MEEVNKELDPSMNAFLVMCTYNGWDEKMLELIDKLKEDLKDYEQYYGYDMVKHLIDDVDINYPPKIFWGMLVYMYGNYGTSPRYGWLETKHFPTIIKLCDEILAEDILERGGY